jgi:hypothetical protein
MIPHLLEKVGTSVIVVWFLALLFLMAAVFNG